jgi:fatty acid desaturase
MSVASSPKGAPSLKDQAFIEKLQKLRQTDNVTNLFYLARTWSLIALVIGSAIFFFENASTFGVSFYANVPVALLAITLIGALQHQLTGLAHEASHHTLLKHRYLNDLVSDLFCMFPMFSSTHHYRLQHMAHHQFVNDPDRDPDVSQLKTSGHWISFPVSKKDFLVTLIKQLVPTRLIKYIRVRAQYNSVGTNHNPYAKKGHTPSRVPVLVGILYMLSLIASLTGLVMLGNRFLLAAVPIVGWIGMMTFYSLIPADWFHQSRVHPVISARHMTFMRITFITALFTSLAWIQLLTGAPAAIYFGLLWLVPIFTSFSFFMILRQLVQHGNGDRGFLTNTRTFFVHPFIRFAVFPLGQDYHLPHHMFATVPHFRLKQLHQLLSGYPEYQEKGVIVEGYFWPKHHPPTHPTVLDVVGPEFNHGSTHEIHIDDSVLEQDMVEGAETLTADAIKRRAS